MSEKARWKPTNGNAKRCGGCVNGTKEDGSFGDERARNGKMRNERDEIESKSEGRLLIRINVSGCQELGKNGDDFDTRAMEE